MQAPTVTLLATPDQAETLTLAGNDGRIQLVLRNSSDAAIEKTTGRVISELYNARVAPKPVPVAPRPRPQPVAQVAPPPPPPAPVAPPPPDTVVVIRGGTRTVETIPNSAKN